MHGVNNIVSPVTFSPLGSSKFSCSILLQNKGSSHPLLIVPLHTTLYKYGMQKVII